MGMFDMFSSDDPAEAGRMALIAGLLGGKGNFNGILGRSMMGAQEAAQSAKQRQQASELNKMQLEEIKRRAARQQREDEMAALPGKFLTPASMPGIDATGGMETALENPNNAAGPGGFNMQGYLGALMGKDPIAALQLQAMTKKQAPQPISLGAEQRLVDPTSFKELVPAVPKPDKPDKGTSDLQNYNAVKAQGYAGTFEKFLREQANLKAPRTNVSVNTGQKGFDNTLKLRGDFRSEPIYKAHSEVQAAHAQITAGLKLESPAGDLAGATKIMKILDPTSVVRESELGMAIAATGLLDRVQNYAQQVISGVKLSPSQRKDFKNLADKLTAESAKLYNAKRSEYEGIAKRNALNVQDVVGGSVGGDGGEWSIKPVP